MFSRKSCYFFVRPKKTFLEVCVFLGRAVKGPQIRRVDRSSKSKLVHVLRITHRDEVEAPVTDWLREAYDFSGLIAAKTASPRAVSKGKPARKMPASATNKRVTKRKTTTKTKRR